MTNSATQSRIDGLLHADGVEGKVLFGAHIAVFAIGCFILMANALQPNVWFEEAYSAAMAQHSFGEIWSMSAYDVHPILYYCALHVINLVFGSNIVAYRVFSVLGVVVLSLLGLTHIRKDFGAKTGLMFSALAYFLPWSVYIAFQVRMYSWLAVAMTFVIIYAWRIVDAQYPKTMASGRGVVPVHWWIAFFAATIVSAYLHYYGTIAAVVAQVFMLASLVRAKAGAKVIRNWLIGFVVTAIALIPCALVALSQFAAVDQNAFWSHFDYAKSSAKVYLFPFDSPELGNYTSLAFTSATGELPEDADMKASFNLTVEIIALTMAASCACIASVFSFGLAAGEGEGKKRTGVNPLVLPIAMAVTVCAVATAFSVVLFDEYLYYRFAPALIGPLAFGMAYVFAHTRKMLVGVIACLLCVACGGVAYNSAYALSHSEYNGAVHELYESTHAQARNANNGEEPLLLGTSASTTGMMAITEPGETIHYVSETPDPQVGAFGPRVVVEDDAEALLGDYHGSALVIGSLQDTENIANRFGGRVIEYHNALQVYANGYSNGWFDFAVIAFD